MHVFVCFTLLVLHKQLVVTDHVRSATTKSLLTLKTINVFIVFSAHKSRHADAVARLPFQHLRASPGSSSLWNLCLRLRRLVCSCSCLHLCVLLHSVLLACTQNLYFVLVTWPAANVTCACELCSVTKVCFARSNLSFPANTNSRVQ